VRSVYAPVHAGAGGALQVTPAQGSPMQLPALQPFAQVVSADAYVQLPPLQVPVDE
jgi:hypothetical protein